MPPKHKRLGELVWASSQPRCICRYFYGDVFSHERNPCKTLSGADGGILYLPANWFLYGISLHHRTSARYGVSSYRPNHALVYSGFFCAAFTAYLFSPINSARSFWLNPLARCAVAAIITSNRSTALAGQVPESNTGSSASPMPLWLSRPGDGNSKKKTHGLGGLTPQPTLSNRLQNRLS